MTTAAGLAPGEAKLVLNAQADLSDEEVAGLHGNSERYVERAAVYAAESASGEG